MDSCSSIAQVMNKSVWETCTSRIPPQLIPSIDENMHSKEKEKQEIQNDPYKHVSKDERLAIA